MAQAEIYLKAACDAAGRLDEATPEEGTMLLLEARILAARSKFKQGRGKALEALSAYQRWENHRGVSAAVNFLNILAAAFPD